jgi:hypothetical protein
LTLALTNDQGETMNRTAIFSMLTGCVLLAATPARSADAPIPVRKVDANQRATASNVPNVAVIGSLADGEGHGHLVVTVPGTDRVWDGNTIGGFKDLLAGKPIGSAKVLQRMNTFLREQFPHDAFSDKSPTAAQLNQHFAAMSKDQKQEFLNRYIDSGARITNSFRATPDTEHGEKVAPLGRVSWYQVTLGPKAADLKELVRSYEPTKGFPQGLRCNDFALHLAPVLAQLVHSVLGKDVETSAKMIDNTLSRAASPPTATAPRTVSVQPSTGTLHGPFPPTPPADKGVRINLDVAPDQFLRGKSGKVKDAILKD